MYKKILFLSFVLSASTVLYSCETDLLAESSRRTNGISFDTPAISMIVKDDQCQIVRPSCFKKAPKEITNANRAARYLLYVCLREKSKRQWCYLPLDMFKADGTTYKTEHDTVDLTYEKSGKSITKTFVLDNSFAFTEHNFKQWIKAVDESEGGCFCSCF